MRFSLPDLAIRRPVTTVMLLLTVMGFGLIAYTRIPLEFLSLTDFPVLSCYIPYPGAVPAQVEEEIAIPSEGVFKTIPHMKHIYAWSDSDGCFLFMRFEWGTDMSIATAEVRDRIERLKLQLPDEVERFFLRRRGQGDRAIMWFALFRGDDREEIGRLAQKYLRPRLERIDGIAEVNIHGGDYGVVYVEFDQNALRSANLGLAEVVASLQRSSLNLGVGRLQDGESKHFVRAVGEHRQLADLEQLIIGPSGTRLKEVSTVSFRAPPREHVSRMDGQRGVFVSVQKESQANAVATCARVREVLEEVKQEPEFRGTKSLIFFDQSEMIRSTLSSLVSAGKFGGILALAVLFIFLRRFWTTVVVALAIPASLVVAFVVMYFAGISFNVVTMSAMIVSLGMLIDNSIVVMENIRRHQGFDPDPVSSAKNGALEVGLAITTATLTTMVVFVPVLYMQQGEMAIYMRQFAIPIGVALISSLVLALTVIPLAASRIFRRESKPGWIRRRFEGPVAGGRLGRFLRFLGRGAEVYPRVLAIALHHRLAGVFLLAGLLAATYFVPFPKVGMQHMPDMDMRQVSISVEFERYNKDLADQTFESIEKRLNGLREELGVENIYVSYGPWGGRVELHLADPEDLPRGAKSPPTTEEIREILAEKFPDRLPGAELHFGIPSAGENETQKVTVNLRGEDATVVAKYAERLKEMLRSLPDVVDATTSRENDETEIQLAVDEALASSSGVDPMMVAQTVGFALRGTPLQRMKLGEREVEVRAQFQEEDRKTAENLRNVSLLTPSGELVPVSRLVTSEKGRAAQSLRREDGRSVVNVTAEVKTKNMMGVQRGVEAMKKSFVMPRNYSVGEGSMLEEMQESQLAFRSALIMSMALIYLLMAALFESYLLPLSILTTVPLAFVGVYWSMWLTSTPLDTVALIGAVLMCGIIVNNAIVIIDHINQLRRKQEMPRTEAILQGGRDRLRPVMMTAITTILGCVPLAVGTGSDFDLLYSMGRALVGGLTMGTVLTLFVVPVFYSLVDDLQEWVRDYLGVMAQVGSPRAESAPR